MFVNWWDTSVAQTTLILTNNLIIIKIITDVLAGEEHHKGLVG